MVEKNTTDNDRRIAKFLGEDLPKKPKYNSSKKKIKEILKKIIEMEDTVIYFDDEVWTKEDPPKKFNRFKIKHGCMYTHIMYDTFTNEHKIYVAVGALLEDIIKD